MPTYYYYEAREKMKSGWISLITRHVGEMIEISLYLTKGLKFKS